uniref:Protein kinase domain-containing protein n=1 Tax=Romanomermis culicivorax TaxID=13658 RepID=A0A915IJF6_ROMCU
MTKNREIEECKAAFILHGTATVTAAVTNQAAVGKSDVKYDWLHVTCIEIRLVTPAMTVAMSFIHRDIKPSNFAIGRLPRDVRTVYILDFGLVRSYMTSTGEIRPPRDRVGFRGTVRYAALNAHLCKELSRADDLWSWLYMIAEMFIGELPWRNETDRDRVGRMKQTIPRHKLLTN